MTTAAAAEGAGTQSAATATSTATSTTIAATDGSATSAYSSAGTKYGTTTYTDAAGNGLPAEVTNGSVTSTGATSTAVDAGATIGANASAGTAAVDAGSVKGVNPTGSTQNCTNCVAVVDNLLTTGNPASALPRATPVPFDQLGQMYGTEFTGWTTPQNIESTLLAGGDGTRAVIYGTDGETGHVWNAVVQNGKVNYIDGQIGGDGAGNFKAFTNFQFGIIP